MLVNVVWFEEIVFGVLIMVLMGNLMQVMCYQFVFGDEVIVIMVDYESNIGLWCWFEEFGVIIKVWLLNDVIMDL